MIPRRSLRSMRRPAANCSGKWMAGAIAARTHRIPRKERWSCRIYWVARLGVAERLIRASGTTSSIRRIRVKLATSDLRTRTRLLLPSRPDYSDVRVAFLARLLTVGLAGLRPGAG